MQSIYKKDKWHETDSGDEMMTKKHTETKLKNFAFITLVFGVFISANFITDILIFAVHTDGAIIYDNSTIEMLFNKFIWCCVGFTPFMLVIMAWLLIDKDEDLDKELMELRNNE